MKLTLISAQLGVDGGIASSHTIKGPQRLVLEADQTEYSVSFK